MMLIIIYPETMFFDVIRRSPAVGGTTKNLEQNDIEEFPDVR